MCGPTTRKRNERERAVYIVIGPDGLGSMCVLALVLH